MSGTSCASASPPPLRVGSIGMTPVLWHGKQARSGATAPHQGVLRPRLLTPEPAPARWPCPPSFPCQAARTGQPAPGEAVPAGTGPGHLPGPAPHCTDCYPGSVLPQGPDRWQWGGVPLGSIMPFPWGLSFLLPQPFVGTLKPVRSWKPQCSDCGEIRKVRGGWVEAGQWLLWVGWPMGRSDHPCHPQRPCCVSVSHGTPTRGIAMKPRLCWVCSCGTRPLKSCWPTRVFGPPWRPCCPTRVRGHSPRLGVGNSSAHAVDPMTTSVIPQSATFSGSAGHCRQPPSWTSCGTT